jgi:hypothetical protein
MVRGERFESINGNAQSGTVKKFGFYGRALLGIIEAESRSFAEPQ